MGNPRQLRKKYQGPGHPWQKQRIEEEKSLVRDYGLKNKQEVYRANSRVKTYMDTAKRLIAATGAQADKEREQLLSRLVRLGVFPEGSGLDNVLSLTTQDILERRLQTLVCRKGYARTMRQARQFITHCHVMVGDKVVTAPGYIVLKEEESSITFHPRSVLASEEHPERARPEPVAEAPAEEEEKPKKAKKAAKKAVPKKAEATPEAAKEAEAPEAKSEAKAEPAENEAKEAAA